MVTNDATIVHLKHKVMERVAKLAWEDNLNEQSMNDLDVALKLGMNPDECKPLQEKLVKKFGMNM